MKLFVFVCLMSLSLNTYVNAAASPTFYIEGKVGNVNSNAIELISLNGKKKYYPRTFFKAGTNFKVGDVVKAVVRFDQVGDLIKKQYADK